MRVGSLAAALVATATLAAASGARPSAAPFSGATIVQAAIRRTAVQRIPVERTIPAPAPAGPEEDATLDHDPTLSWKLAAPLDGARVELSPTPAFDEVETVRFDASGEQLVVPAVPGSWYWRLRGRSSGDVGEAVSRTRSFRIAMRRSPGADDVDWTNPYDVLLHGRSLGRTRDMR